MTYVVLYSHSTHMSNFQTTYKQLNPQQRQAVDTIDGPVMVIAGPGTGKTQTLALRIANILQKTDTPPHAIMALTFTESGAAEMKTRLVDLIGADGYYVFINTFHGFATAVIKEHPDIFEYSEQISPLSDLERLQIITQIIDHHHFKILKPAGAPHLYIKPLIKAIQDLKREGYTPQKFKEFLKKLPNYHELPAAKPDNKQSQKLQELHKVFEQYESQLRISSRFDFEDMINRVTLAFSQNQEILLEYQERFHYFLADEYQDTNSAQNNLLLKLASYWGKQANIFVVGDPNQSIYRFQGASLENILTFRDNYPNAKIINLKSNYRSQQTILDAAHELVKPCEGLEPSQGFTSTQPLKSQTRLSKSNINLAIFPSPVLEYIYIASQIKNLIKSGTNPSQIAVIYRDNADSSEIADTLGQLDIKYNLEGGDNILHAGIIKRLLTIFKGIHALKDKSEDLNLFTLLNYDFLDIDPLEILKLSRYASENKINFLEAIERVHLNNQTMKQSGNRYEFQNLKSIKNFIDKLISYSNLDSNATFTQFFETVLNDSGYLNWILAQPDSTRKLNQLNSLFKYIKQLNAVDHDLNLEKFLHSLEIMEENYMSIPENDLDIDTNAVRLTTAHKAKGQEYEHVFIIKAYDTKWSNKRVPQLIKLPKELVIHHPSPTPGVKNSKTQGVDQNAQIAEERRLFYVALTRAKKQINITYSTKYDTKQVVPTLFLSEIPKKYISQIDTSKFQSHVEKILPQLLKPINLQSTILNSEKDFLQKILSDFKLNPTALNTYLQCPYKFKLDTLLRTPRAKPEPMAYGTAVHSALEQYFKKYKSENNPPSIKYLLKVFNNALEKEILNKNQLKNWQRRGEKALKLYISHYHDELQPPITTEKFFGSRLRPIMLGDIPLSGKIDKIERLSASNAALGIVEKRSAVPQVLDSALLHSTNQKSVRLIDYKTGRPKSRNEILGNTKNSDGSYHRQLIFYQLLTQLDKTFKYQVVETQLDFIEANDSGKLKRETFMISKEEVKKLKELIKETMARIRHFEFPRTTDHSICQNCQFQNHCWPEGVTFTPRR